MSFLNPFTLRKWAALMISSFLTVICFFVGIKFYGFLWAMVLMFVGLFTGLITGNALLSNPFSKMLEGKGILAINMDSTGIIRPFIVGLQAPYVKGKVNKKWISDIWDRNTVMAIAEPIKNSTDAEKKDGGLKFEINEEEYNTNRFGLFHYPVLIWNDQISSFLTKEQFSKMEKTTFAEHGVLYLNRRMEELTSAIRDFGRYVVESTRPAKGIFGKASTWVIIIVVVLIVILVIMFLPAILDAMKGAYGATSTSLAKATSGQTITPK